MFEKKEAGCEIQISIRFNSTLISKQTNRIAILFLSHVALRLLLFSSLPRQTITVLSGVGGLTAQSKLTGGSFFFLLQLSEAGYLQNCLRNRATRLSCVEVFWRNLRRKSELSIFFCCFFRSSEIKSRRERWNKRNC